jgi:hypothetical protein
MNPFPLTPAQALAVAALVDTHPNPLPHWAGWVKALRTWAAAEFEASQPVEEPEPVQIPVTIPRAMVETSTVDLVAALRASVEAAKSRRAAGETR